MVRARVASIPPSLSDGTLVTPRENNRPSIIGRSALRRVLPDNDLCDAPARHPSSLIVTHRHSRVPTTTARSDDRGAMLKTLSPLFRPPPTRVSKPTIVSFCARHPEALTDDPARTGRHLMLKGANHEVR